MSLVTSALLLSRGFLPRGVSLPTDVANLVVAYAASDNQPWIPVFDPITGRFARRAVNPIAYPLLQNRLEFQSFGQSLLGPLHAVLYNDIRIDQCRWGLVEYESVISDSPAYIVSFYVLLELPSGGTDTIRLTCIYSSAHYMFGLIRGTVYRPYLDEWSRESPITSFHFNNDVMTVAFTDIHGQWELNPALNVFDFDVHTPNLWD